MRRWGTALAERMGLPPPWELISSSFRLSLSHLQSHFWSLLLQEAPKLQVDDNLPDLLSATSGQCLHYVALEGKIPVHFSSLLHWDPSLSNLHRAFGPSNWGITITDRASLQSNVSGGPSETQPGMSCLGPRGETCFLLNQLNFGGVCVCVSEGDRGTMTTHN